MGVQTGVAIAARRFEGVGPRLQGAHLFKRVIHACLYTPEQGFPRPLNQRSRCQTAVAVLSCSTHTRPPLHAEAVTATTGDSAGGLDRSDH
jgi:hypothetical protein